MTVLVNHVILENGVPARMHFTDHAITARTITEANTQRGKIVNTLEFTVDRLDGLPVHATFSTIAEKLAGQFEPYLKDKGYRNYEVIITQSGEGFQRRWSVQFIPLGPR